MPFHVERKVLVALLRRVPHPRRVFFEEKFLRLRRAGMMPASGNTENARSPLNNKRIQESA